MAEMKLYGGPLAGKELVGPPPPLGALPLITGPGTRMLYRVLGQDEAGVWVAEFVRMLPSGPTKA
ncbi:hypothetical protein [Kitasatospora sp. NPDC015120]|uniref:hypothetical protein n=1 Tax=Kitasatospora sp. NPDC015120 TaxID=3364023 RepID=UPI0036F47F5E